MNHAELFGTLATWPGNWFATYNNDALVGALCQQHGFRYERLLIEKRPSPAKNRAGYWSRS